MKNRQLYAVLISSLVLFFVIGTTGTYAYDDKIVHPEINEWAGRQSSLDDFIKTQLGFSAGINTTFLEKECWDWLRQGGTDEDAGVRWMSHFHDPLEPWDNSGLWNNDTLWHANLAWAQRPGNAFSWSAAREHYYQALVTQYESEFAQTFLTLGHLMHLVADMAVPAHVRDDAHPLGDLYEKWATIHCDPDKPAEFSCNFNYPDEPAKRLTPSLSIFVHANPADSGEAALAPEPISALWDQNKYRKILDNPWVTRTGISPESLANIGLAEYTNANFFSQDTIFYGYDHPSKTEAYTRTGALLSTVRFTDISIADLEIQIAEDNTPDFRIYAYASDEQGEYHLASLGYFFEEETLVEPGGTDTDHTLDDTVLADYAARLVPRAVGYSTALLDYFFRGRIGMRIAPEWMLVARREYEGLNTWHDNANRGLSRIGVWAWNTSTPAGGVIEAMDDGSIELVVVTDRYVLHCPQAINTNSRAIGTDEQLFVFDISQLPISMPADGSGLEVDLYLVYHGRLGQESNGVAVGHQRMLVSNNMTVSLPPKGVYAASQTMPWELADPGSQGFDTITLLVHNDVATTQGDLHLAATYRVTQENPFTGNISEPPGTSWRVSRGVAYSARVPTLSDNNGLPVQLTFSLDRPIPMYATDLRLHLYMDNAYGTQSIYDTGFKDVSEPHIFAVINKSTAGAATCYYMHHSDLYIKPVISSQYYPAEPVSISSLGPGRAWRIAVISDYQVIWDHPGFWYEPSSKCSDSPDTYHHSAHSMNDVVNKNQGDYFTGSVCTAGTDPCYGFITAWPPYFHDAYYFNTHPYDSGFLYFNQTP